MCHGRPEDRIPAEELRTIPRLNNIRECGQDRGVQWFSELERIEELGLVNVAPSRIISST